MLVVTWCEARFFFNPADVNIHKIVRITFLYTGFAFVISLIREAIKDMEDIEGDQKIWMQNNADSLGLKCF